MKNIITALFLIAIIFISSCTPSRKVIYKLDEVLAEPETLNASISLQLFKDIREESKINKYQLRKNSNPIIIKNKSTCVNSDKYYKTSLNIQLTSMLAYYLKKKKYYASVGVNKKEGVDYYVTAKLKHFIGLQEYSYDAGNGIYLGLNGVHFGLVGALIATNLKTKGNILIELTDISIYNKNRELIVNMGDLKKNFDGEFPVNANCKCIYENINQCLSEFNEELGEMIFYEIERDIEVNRTVLGAI